MSAIIYDEKSGVIATHVDLCFYVGFSLRRSGNNNLFLLVFACVRLQYRLRESPNCLI